MKQMLLLSAFVLLSGCTISDQKQQLASCTLDATRAHPGDERAFSPEGSALEKVIGRDVALCMTKNGYERSWADNECQPNLFGSSMEEQDYCYVPSGSVGKAEFQIERWFEHQTRKSS